MTYNELLRRLGTVYTDGHEAQAVARMLLEEAFGLTLTDICCGKVTQLSANDAARLEKMTQRLEKAEPVQYVLGYALFDGQRFRVSRHVLIPRPETEQLCSWVADTLQQCGHGTAQHPRVLDVGTGSGCIAVTVARHMPQAQVEAIDVSAPALAVAQANAARLQARVAFRRQDALHMPAADAACYDAIVSNPPYICQSEQAAMHDNVLRHEPHLALFVPDADPLRFYRAIARYAARALKPGGAVLFEVNPLYTGPMEEMMLGEGLVRVECRDDCFGRPRFMRAFRPSGR